MEQLRGYTKMMKQNVSLEISRNDRLFQFILSPEASLGECFDVLTQLRQYIIDRIKAEEDKPKEVPKEE